MIGEIYIMKTKFFWVVILVIILFSLIFLNTRRSKTIEEILKVNFDDIAYIKTNSDGDTNYDVNKFIKKFGDKKYKTFKGLKGSTANLRYTCFNNDGKVIFTLVDVGNKNLIILIKNDSNSSANLYQQIN